MKKQPSWRSAGLTAVFLLTYLVGQGIVIFTAETSPDPSRSRLANISVSASLMLVILAWLLTVVVYLLLEAWRRFRHQPSVYPLMVAFFQRRSWLAILVVVIGFVGWGGLNAYYEDYRPVRTAETTINRALKRHDTRTLKRLSDSNQTYTVLKTGHSVTLNQRIAGDARGFSYLGELTGLDGGPIQVFLSQKRYGPAGLIVSYQVTEIISDNAAG